MEESKLKALKMAKNKADKPIDKPIEKSEKVTEVKEQDTSNSKDLDSAPENSESSFFDDLEKINKLYESGVNEEGKNIDIPKEDDIENVNTDSYSEIKPIITGAFLILIIDLFAPKLVFFIYKRFVKKDTKVKPSDIKLSDDDKEDLEPMADEVVKLIVGTTNPVTAFTISLSVMYFMNIQEVEKKNK